MQAGESERLRTFRRHQARRCTDRTERAAAVAQTLHPHAAQHRAPIVTQRAHGIARKDLLAHIVIVGGVGDEGELPASRIGHLPHLVVVEIFELVAHEQLALERQRLGEAVEVRRHADCSELRCGVERERALIGNLGALVELDAQLEFGIRAQERRFMAHRQPTGIGIGGVDRVEHRQLRERFGEAVDIGDLRAGLETGGTGKLDGLVQRQPGDIGVGEVVADGRAQRAGARTVEAGLSHHRAIVLRAGEIAQPQQLPAVGDLVLAGQRIGEDRLPERAQRRTLADVDPVNRAFGRRIADADIGIAAGRRRGIDRAGAICRIGDEIALAIVEVETIVAALFVIGEDGVERAQGNSVGRVRPPIRPR